MKKKPRKRIKRNKSRKKKSKKELLTESFAMTAEHFRSRAFATNARYARTSTSVRSVIPRKSTTQVIPSSKSEIPKLPLLKFQCS